MRSVLRVSLKSIVAVAMVACLCEAASAQDDGSPKDVPFAGGHFTIEQSDPSGEKTLAFDGREIAHNYHVNFEGTTDVTGTDVAVFSVGDGGNACGPAIVLAWKPEGQDLRSASVGEDECGAPPPAITSDAIYFVPYLMPGDSAPVRMWNPQDGLVTAGMLTFMAEPDTGWDNVKSEYAYILDAFRNEAVYHNAQAQLGDRLTEVATSLLVGSGTEKTPSGVVYAHGCVPHACGGSDGFMAIDAANHKLYFAIEGDKPKPDAWPALETWPKDLRAAQEKAFAN